MTVQAVNTKVIKQSAAASAIAGTTQAAGGAESEFSDLLQKIGTTFRVGANTSTSDGGLTAAIKQSDAANSQAQAEAPRSRSDRSSKSRDSNDSTPRADATDNRQARAARKAERSQDSDGKKTAASDATASEDSDTTTATLTTGATAQDSGLSVQNDTQTIEAAAFLDQGPVIVDPTQMAQMIGPQVVQQGPVIAQDDGLPTEDLLAQGPQQMLGDMVQTTETTDTAQVTNDAFSLAMQAGPAKAGQHGQDNSIMRQQADDLAQRIDDPSAQLDITVAVSNQTAATDVSAVAQQVQAPVEAAPLIDPALDAANQPITTAASPTTTAQATAPTLAQQTNPAINSPLAAVIAAQAEATTGVDAAAAPDTQNQTAQPVAGVTGTSSTQAAQKSAAAQTAQAPRQPVAAKPEELTEQISVQISQNNKDGTDTIKVQLKPVELGAVEVKMDVAKDGTVNAVVTADSQETLDLMKKDQQGLEKALQDAGLKTENGSLTFNLRGENQQQNTNGNSRQSRRSRLTVAAAADAASAQSAAAAQARWGGSRSGVNIQV